MAKQVLGRGLGALLSSPLSATVESTSSGNERNCVIDIPLSEIRQNPLQPRRDFNADKLQELAESIKVHGVVQPIVVAKAAEGYRLIVGERRCRAARIAGLSVIPSLVRDFADQQMLEVALIENLQREDLNPIEAAQAFQYLLREHNLTHEQLSERLGCSRPAITNALRLLSLPDEMRRDLESGELKPGHARAILSLDDEKMRFKVWHCVKDNDMSVRQTEKMVTDMKKVPATTPKPVSEQVRLSSDWREYAQILSERLNAEVRIVPKAKGCGRIELHYADQEELERFMDMLAWGSWRHNGSDEDFLS